MTIANTVLIDWMANWNYNLKISTVQIFKNAIEPMMVIIWYANPNWTDNYTYKMNGKMRVVRKYPKTKQYHEKTVTLNFRKILGIWLDRKIVHWSVCGAAAARASRRCSWRALLLLLLLISQFTFPFLSNTHTTCEPYGHVFICRFFATDALYLWPLNIPQTLSLLVRVVKDLSVCGHDDVRQRGDLLQTLTHSQSQKCPNWVY